MNFLTVETKENQEQKDLTQEISTALEEIVQEPDTTSAPTKGAKVTVLPDGQLLIDDKAYGLVYNYREGFEPEKLGERFSEILTRYDYIVGDWGYEQLRLKGFFDNDNKRAFPEQKIQTLEDYLYEFCNFGCRYFVIEKMNKKKEKPKATKKRHRKPNNKNNQAFVEEKVQPVTGKTKPVIHRKKPEAPTKNSRVMEKQAGFTIRKRED